MCGPEGGKVSEEQMSPRMMARVVGVVGLLGIVAGAFDVGYVQNVLLVNGNAVATLRHLREHGNATYSPVDECLGDYAFVDDEAGASSAVGLAPLMTSHSMSANSPNIAG